MLDDLAISPLPKILEAILVDTAEIEFGMASEQRTGGLLRALAAAKPGGEFLELGTGTGVSAAWLLDGMDERATLDSVDNDARAQGVARHHLRHDARVTFHLSDGAEFLSWIAPRQFDLVFADTWAGKFTHLDEALALVRVGGIYLVDDLLPQPNWPDGHDAKVDRLISTLDRRRGFAHVKLGWSSGVMMLVRVDG